MTRDNEEKTSKNQERLNDRLISIYEKALQRDPNDKLIYIDLGNLYEEKGLSKKAIELYEKAIKLGTDESLINHLLVRVYEEEGAYEKAIVIYEKILNKDPYNIIATEGLPRLYLKLKNPALDQAKDMIERVRAINLVNDLRQMAEEKERQSLYDSAVEIYRQIIKIDPDYLLAYHRIAKVYRFKGDTTKAIRFYEIAIKLNKEDYLSYLWLGILDALFLNKGKAMERLEKVINNSPNKDIKNIAFSVYNYLKSEAYVKGNQEDQVVSLRTKGQGIEKSLYKYKEILRSNKDTWLTHFYLGTCYFIKGLYNKAEIEFKILQKINPQSEEARLISSIKNSVNDLTILEE
ncbi:MAG: tetratricopeptide repeat protein [bacterium]